MALTLSSETLSISVLDPNNPVDDDKKGARYCTGGYIFQVKMRRSPDTVGLGYRRRSLYKPGRGTDETGRQLTAAVLLGCPCRYRTASEVSC